MTILATFGGTTAVDTGDITKSLRFRASGSTYLSKTFGSSGSRTTWTWSGWVKRGALGADMVVLGTYTSASEYHLFVFNPANRLQFTLVTGGVNRHNYETNMVFRDPSAFFHVVLAFDTTQATATDRIKLYINGTQVTSWATQTNPAQNQEGYISHTVANNIGRLSSGSQYFDGYLSRICFVDGTALTPSSFGYLNTEINEWVTKSRSACKAVVDAGGTNSFMLDFNDGTSLTTLGNDFSTKNNDWTLTNHSLTAGVDYDWMDDRPGNSYATLNPLYPFSSTVKPSKGNLSFVTSPNSFVSTGSVSAGKHYFEASITAKGGTAVYDRVGIFSDSSLVFYRSSGAKEVNGVGTAYGATWGIGDVIGVSFDADAGSIEFFKNGASQGVLTGNTFTTAVAYIDTVAGTSPTISGWANFGQRPFAYTPPTGFVALCQANLPTPAILNPKAHFDVVTRTGTAATANITSLSFAPDFVWFKSRGRVLDHALYDRVRGAQNELITSSTAAETTQATGLTAFNSNGYTIGALDKINGTTATNSFVDWAWKANGAAVTNTSGTITSQVSANQTAGFSIVTYTGTGANATVGHGLGVAPKMVIVKQRNVLGTSWTTFHKSVFDLVSNAYAVFIESTSAAANAPTAFNSTGPTSTVFSLGTGGGSLGTNVVSNTYVAYCFAEIPGYSKIGSYTGNNSADGPFVFCGFKPRFLLVKCSSNAANWVVMDAARSPVNVAEAYLVPNASAGEQTAYFVDFTSSGFKIRGTQTEMNGNGYTFVFIAIAETTGKYSNAR